MNLREGLEIRGPSLVLSGSADSLVDIFSLCCRFLVHRYSVLQHNAEANGIEGMDEALDTNMAAHTKIGFHDDSDEVQLKKLFD